MKEMFISRDRCGQFFVNIIVFVKMVQLDVIVVLKCMYNIDYEFVLNDNLIIYKYF